MRRDGLLSLTCHAQRSISPFRRISTANGWQVQLWKESQRFRFSRESGHCLCSWSCIELVVCLLYSHSLVSWHAGKRRHIRGAEAGAAQPANDASLQPARQRGHALICGSSRRPRAGMPFPEEQLGAAETAAAGLLAAAAAGAARALLAALRVIAPGGCCAAAAAAAATPVLIRAPEVRQLAADRRRVAAGSIRGRESRLDGAARRRGRRQGAAVPHIGGYAQRFSGPTLVRRPAGVLAAAHVAAADVYERRGAIWSKQ